MDVCRVVDRFYKFWFGFKSWREFPHPDEEDIEQAECREDRCPLTLHQCVEIYSTSSCAHPMRLDQHLDGVLQPVCWLWCQRLTGNRSCYVN